MSSADRIEMAMRFEIREELESKFAPKIKGIEAKLLESEKAMEQLRLENSSLKLEVESKEEALKTREKSSLEVHKRMSDAEGRAQSLESQLKKAIEKFESQKEELSKLKALDPKTIKKRLDNALKKIKDKDSVIENYKRSKAELMKKNREYFDGVKTMKERIERIQRRSDETEDDTYLFVSKCGRYRIFGTSFSSESRPFVGDEMNYRVVDMEDGASMVAKFEDDRVIFEMPEKIPNELFKYVEAAIKMSRLGSEGIEAD